MIRGQPGIGKTTLIKKLSTDFDFNEIGGFYTEEIRKGENRVGFKIITFGKGERILAHIDFNSPYRVSKYFIDVDGFEKLVIPELEEAKREKRIIFIDEIGKMELFSEKFKAKVKEIFHTSKIVVATIPIAKLAFIEEIILFPKVFIYELTFANRQSLYQKLKEEIRKTKEKIS